jgi:hypothetical protein
VKSDRVTQKETTPDAVLGGISQWKREGLGAGIDLRLVRGAVNLGGELTVPGEKEIQEGDKNTSTDEQEARAPDRVDIFRLTAAAP